MASSRVEELPDDFDESLDLSKTPSTNASSATPQPPAGGTSIDQVLKEFSKTPLFMDQLDVEDADVEQNALFEAMRSLQYEGSKLEVAQNLKEQGNEQAKLKRWKDGREFYTKAIAVLLGKVELSLDPDAPPQPEGEKIGEAEKETSLLETCFVNRALCQLEIGRIDNDPDSCPIVLLCHLLKILWLIQRTGNYRSTTLDCAAALQINPANVKAYYRSATALLKVNKLEEAEDACNRGLKIEPHNSALKKLQDQLVSKRANSVEARAAKQKEIETKKRQQFILTAALKARNIAMRGSQAPPDLDDAAVHLEPDPESPESSLVFPAIFLYPMHAQSDFVKNFGELQSIADHLSYIFPLPWDTEGLYKPSSVECFMDTTTGGLIKVGKKLSLLKLLSNGKTEVVDGLVKIHVVPASLAPKWVEEMKTRKKS
ncbi:putative tpr repeat protein [Phaeomoniella chlamydospora]|uniref:Putative tpr repeat protein n=1 Tax=Phaeomoniella chlamydospora TaxID=158046 RepID=A0A0G2F4K5_PHACM|nr:putative tpr repeat protein [Phaeomoniella chlamydospora]